LMFVPSLTCTPYLVFVPYFIPNFYLNVPTMVYSSYDENEDGNTLPLTHLP